MLRLLSLLTTHWKNGPSWVYWMNPLEKDPNFFALFKEASSQRQKLNNIHLIK